MIRYTFLFIVRNFKRFKSTFLINLVGLSTGLACATLIYLWVADELGIDKFHEHDDRLFQVWAHENRPDGIVTLGAAPALLEEALAAEFPEIEYTVGSSSVQRDFVLTAGAKNVSASGQLVGRNFFNIFSYPLLHGDRDQVLADKKSIVVSEQMAVALFNTTDNIIGKTLEWEMPRYKQQVTVTGVFKDIPKHSSLQFDFVLSYEVYKELLGDGLHWGNYNAITYVLLRENADFEDFNAKIENFVRGKQADSRMTLFAKPYSDNYLYSHYDNGKVVGGRITYVKLFSAIAVFILIIACINFMNLATAKAAGRIKEVGIKKAVGAGRGILIFQYLTESLVMSFLSLAISLLIVDLFLPQFNVITGKELVMPLSGQMFYVLLGITVLTGILAGSYPALYLSGFNPATVLKGRLVMPGGEQWARKGLVIFQFTLAVIFVVSVLVVYKQMEYVQTKHLGYDRDNIVHFKIEGSVSGKLDTFLDELRNIPGVVEASGMWGSVMGLTGFTTGSFDWKGMDPTEVLQFEHLGVHYDLIEVLGMEMVAGRSFSRNSPSDTRGIIFNETAIKTMGLEDPVGERFSLWGNEYKIIGVVKDFHFKSLHEEVTPFFLRLTPGEYNKVLVKLEAGRERETIEEMQKFYAAFNPGYAFNYQFLDAAYQAQYVAEQRVASLSGYFAGLAILISCLGLFGLSAFTAERRLKEIGIRKVLGSGVVGIVYLLSADFNKIVIAAVAIALPLSYLGIDLWLSNFAYRIPLQWWYFVGSGVLAFVIAWLTVGMHAWKAASANPVNCLRDE